MPRKNPDATDERILEMYQQLGSGNESARRLGLSIPTVYAALRRHGVPLTRRTGKLRASDEAIAEAYRRLGSGIAVTKELDVCDRTVYEALTRLGIQTGGWHKRLRGVPDDQVPRIIEMHKTGQSVRAIADAMGFKPYSVWSALHRENVDFPSKDITDEEKQRMLTLYLSGLTAKETGDAIGRSNVAVLRFLEKDHPDVIRRLGKRESSPSWKGGRIFHRKSGYWYIHVAEDDPLAGMRNQEGYAPEHRIVKARALGRQLLITETVHHIDGDKTNNVPNNLQLRHGRHGKHIVPCCMDCGSRNIGTAPID